MTVINVKGDDFEEQVLKADLPVFVDFTAEWCGPCRMAGPVIDELAEEYKDKVKFVKVNVDEEKEVASRFGIMSIPTIMIFKDGKEVERQMGFLGKDGFEQMLKKHL